MSVKHSHADTRDLWIGGPHSFEVLKRSAGKENPISQMHLLVISAVRISRHGWVISPRQRRRRPSPVST